MDTMNDEQLTMRQVKAEADKRIRDAFQEKHPHYTPPPDAKPLQWARWAIANYRMHTEIGFKARFPAQEAVLTEELTVAELAHNERRVYAKLHHMTYPHIPRAWAA